MMIYVALAGISASRCAELLLAWCMDLPVPAHLPARPSTPVCLDLARKMLVSRMSVHSPLHLTLRIYVPAVSAALAAALAAHRLRTDSACTITQRL